MWWKKIFHIGINLLISPALAFHAGWGHSLAADIFLQEISDQVLNQVDSSLLAFGFVMEWIGKWL